VPVKVRAVLQPSPLRVDQLRSVLERSADVCAGLGAEANRRAPLVTNRARYYSAVTMKAHTGLLLAGVLLLSTATAACGKKDDPAATGSSGSSGSSGSPATATAGLKEGDNAPDVTLPLQDGKQLKLSSLKGQMAVVYFYPKDQTPGCTVEAENFRDKFDDLKKAGIAVIGVSTQDAASHKAFIDKEKLPFDLAVDEDKSIAKAFGVPPGFMGMHARQTFLIGKDGKIKKIWRDVSPKDHANEVLSAAQS